MHVELTGGRAKSCEVDLTELCRAILRGLKKQLVEGGVMGLSGVGLVCQEPEGFDPWKKMVEPYEGSGFQRGTYDATPGAVCEDVSGAEVDREEAFRAREVELEFTERKPLYQIRIMEWGWPGTSRTQSQMSSSQRPHHGKL